MKTIKAKRIIYNKAGNDFNDECEYKLQKVRIYEETDKNFIIDSYGKFKFSCNKTQVFLSKEDFKNKMNNIQDFNLNDFEKKYLLEQF
ncbi:MAG: hypothetical protein HFJ30_00425 [Clostridia bacterium]|jgi:hypothetical protein|nr:hypothetical protein [Clostridia bacterium]